MNYFESKKIIYEVNLKIYFLNYTNFYAIISNLFI